MAAAEERGSGGSAWQRIVRDATTLLMLGGGAVAIWWNRSVTPRMLALTNAPAFKAMAGSPDLTRYLPDDVTQHLDLAYGSGADDRLDIYHPAAAEAPLPTIVWMHGGGFIGGSKESLRPYLLVLASNGYTIVNVEYTPGPRAHWPRPIQQLREAIALVSPVVEQYRIDLHQLVLGGDSAGAHMAAQAAVAVTNREYAAASGVPAVMTPAQLRGVLLFSGPYDMDMVDTDNRAFAFFLSTVLWAYTGYKDFQHAPLAPYYSVSPWVTSAFPPSFISTGPTDPLLAHSKQLTERLRAQGVDVTALFFPAETSPESIGHEYQLGLDAPEARSAMVGMVRFLREHTQTPLELPGIGDEWPEMAVREE